MTDKCAHCTGEQCQQCQKQSDTVSRCCVAHDRYSANSEAPQLCKEAFLAEEIKTCMRSQCAGCSGDECAACHQRPNVVSTCCDGDFHSAMVPPQCANMTSNPCARLQGAEALACAWSQDVRECVESGCRSCRDCPGCRDSSKVSTCCDQHFHPVAIPAICSEAILTEDVKSCVVARCDGCGREQCQSCQANLAYIATCCREHNHTGIPPPYCDEALQSVAAPAAGQMPILP